MPDENIPDLPEPIRVHLRELSASSSAHPRDDALEDSIVNRLYAQGLLRHGSTAPRAKRRSPFLFAVAAVLLLSVGVSLGRASVPAPAPPATHILLLHGLARVGSQVADDSTTRAVYTAWARSEGASGVVVGGEELGLGGAQLASTSTGSGATAIDSTSSDAGVVGYFLIRAASRDEALQVARRCPHLKYGGTVEVRDIVRR